MNCVTLATGATLMVLRGPNLVPAGTVWETPDLNHRFANLLERTTK